MIFSDKLRPRGYHYHLPIKDASLKPGENLGGTLIWERRVTYFPQGYWASKATWRTFLFYKLYRLERWLAWREADLFDDLETLIRNKTGRRLREGVEAGWKDLWRTLLGKT